MTRKENEEAAPVQFLEKWIVRHVYSLYLQGRSYDSIADELLIGQPSRIVSKKQIDKIIDDMNNARL